MQSKVGARQLQLSMARKELQGPNGCNEKGHAAVAIIRVLEQSLPAHLNFADFNEPLENFKFLFQRKTEGYPFASMVDSICLFGGNRENSDESARDTLHRELNEELGQEFAKEVLQNTSPFAKYTIEAPASAVTPKLLQPYTFDAFVFHSWIRNESLPLECLEGNAVVLTVKECFEDERFAWGYGTPFLEYLETLAVRKPPPVPSVILQGRVKNSTDSCRLVARSSSDVLDNLDHLSYKW